MSGSSNSASAGITRIDLLVDAVISRRGVVELMRLAPTCDKL
jgi:hypothetical protein